METYKLTDIINGSHGASGAETFRNQLERIRTNKHLEAFFLKVMMGHVGPGGDIFAAFGLAREGGHEVRCSLTINGIEVSLTPFVMAYAEGFDRDVRDAALALLREQCDGLSSAVATLTRTVEETGREKLGVPWEE